MKKRCLFLIALLLLLTSCACGEEAIPDRYLPILEAWNATDGESLKYNALLAAYGEVEAKNPLSVRFGGTTEELIREKKTWDLAIVSSKDVDLQRLADEGLLRENGYDPSSSLATLQWLYPDWVQAQLPEHPYLIYNLYCYDFDEETQDVTWLVCKRDPSNNDVRMPDMLAGVITKNRPTALERKTQTIARAVWTGWTVDDLLARPDDWDIANVSLASYDDLDRLDEAGLLYDFNHDPFWATRDTDWPVPLGVYSDDGRLIAIPYAQDVPYDPNREPNLYPHPYQVVIINSRSVDLELSMAYEKRWIQAYEWYYNRIHHPAYSEGVPKKYGHFVMRKEDAADW